MKRISEIRRAYVTLAAVAFPAFVFLAATRQVSRTPSEATPA